MRLHRFIGNFDCSEQSIAITDADMVNQIGNVLRLSVGDQLILCDGKGTECVCAISDRKKNSITATVISKSKNIRDPLVSTVLYCAILKHENFELVVQKATEIGVSEIVPLITMRTVKLDIKEERLQKIIKEAAEQSGRGTVPALHAPMQFADALTHARENDRNFFFALTDVPVTSLQKSNRKGLFIGPEGGWTEEEEVAARDAGCTIVSLGALTLRAETAAIVASYLGTQG